MNSLYATTNSAAVIVIGIALIGFGIMMLFRFRQYRANVSRKKAAERTRQIVLLRYAVKHDSLPAALEFLLNCIQSKNEENVFYNNFRESYEILEVLEKRNILLSDVTAISCEKELPLSHKVGMLCAGLTEKDLKNAPDEETAWILAELQGYSKVDTSKSRPEPDPLNGKVSFSQSRTG